MKRGFSIIFGCFMLMVHYAGAQHRQVLLGDSLYSHSSYAKAIKHYEKALNKVDNQAPIFEKLGNTYFQLQQYADASEQYNKAIDYQENWQTETRWKYLQIQRINGNDQAIRKSLASWASLDEQKAGMLSNSMMAESLFYMDSAAYDIKVTGINSDRSDFAPAYYRDGLVFTSSRGEGNVSTRKYHWDGGYHLDLFYVPLASMSAGAEAATSFGENTTFHDGPAVFFNGDRKVIFTRNEGGRSKDGTRRLMLMEAEVSTEGTWSDIKPLSINSEEYSLSHPALSDDNTILYFISDMPGGQGGTDLWMSRRNGNEWGAPQNLGPTINTSGDEMFPYVYKEELFFASNGHPGLGGMDIFIAQKTEGSGYMIRNAGYPLNTNLDDFGIITRNGREGYFSSNRAGQDDIYHFLKDKTLVDILYVDQEEQLLDSVTTDMGGKKIMPITNRRVTHLILPMNSIQGLKATKENYADTSFSIETGEEFYISRTIPLTRLDDLDRGVIGVYPIAAENKVDFYLATPEMLMHVDDKDGWMSHLNVKNVAGENASNELERLRNILDKNGFDLVVYDTITSIYFDFDKYNIRTSEESNLSRLITLLQKYPSANVVLSAHTDARGSNAYNDKLALKRANAAKDYLIARGVGSKRIEAKAYGERQLLIQCEKCTEEEHQINRRATFGINKND